MEILKQHYEKIVLGALLLGFVFALVYLLQMVDSARHVTDDDLRFTAPKSKYEQQNFSSRDFNVDHILGERSVWEKRGDSSNLGFNAGLVVPMKALRCLKCFSIMPWSMARSKAQAKNEKDKLCPFCRQPISGDPGEAPDFETIIAMLDTDQDGMPDRYETKMGFNPLEAKDADEDKDGDGFSNYYEFMVKTDPTNANDRPGVEKCLYLYRLIKKTMPLMLNGVMVVPDPADKNSKKNWDISLTINNMRESLTIGQEFTVQQKKYRILDAEYKTRDSQEASVVLDNDASRVTIAPVKNNKVDTAGTMVLEVGKKVYEPEHVAMIRDVRDSSRRGLYRKGQDETFTIKDELGNNFTFQVIKTDAVKETVRLQNTDSGEELLLEKRARIPKNAYVKKDGSNNDKPITEQQEERPRRRRRARN